MSYFAKLENTEATEISYETKQQIGQTVVLAHTGNTLMVTILNAEKIAILNLEDEPDIIILPTDKGRVAIIMDRAEYIAKAKTLAQSAPT